MIAGLTAQELREFLNLPIEEKREALMRLGPAALAGWIDHFDFWADRGQHPPDGQWRTWLMMAGRGFGKTRAGAEWVHRLAMGRRRRIALVGATIDEARGVMVEGVSGLLSVARRFASAALGAEPEAAEMAERERGDSCFRATMPTGCAGPSIISPGATSWPSGGRPRSAWDNLQMGLRRGTRPRALVTTTPRPMRLLERITAERVDGRDAAGGPATI